MSCDVYASPSAQRAIHNWHFSSRFWLHCLGEGSDCIQRVLLLSVSEHHLPRHNPLQRIVLGASAERGYSTGAFAFLDCSFVVVNATSEAFCT